MTTVETSVTAQPGNGARPTAASTAAPTDEELLNRFRPVFDRIATGALDREESGRLALEELGWLRDARLTAVRVPRELGGGGASLRQLFLLMVELAAAESNLPHALRIHFRFLEDRWRERDSERGQDWLRRIAGGAILGTAVSERTGPFGQPATTLRQVGGRLLVNGTKYYSTGALYADYVTVAVTWQDGSRAIAVVPSTAPGVQLLDDWAGFGQRASASGTSIFTDVEITDPAQIFPPVGGVVGHLAFLQLFHLATVAGIVRRAVEDTAGFVRQRGRSYPQSGAGQQSDDPLVQQVLGRADAAAHALRAIVLDAAASLEAAQDARWALRTAPAAQQTPARQERVAAAETKAELDAYRAQVVVLDLGLKTTNEIFEVGGSSALDRKFHLDRHWRNARTLASHNPVIYRERQLGDYLLHGNAPVFLSTEGSSGPDQPAPRRASSGTEK
jgi:alkylation response protein AidB-like acyl-CoA dehydrogenase